MPHTDQLPDGALNTIAIQIGRRLPGLLGPDQLTAASVAVTASLEVWSLDLDVRQEPPTADLRELTVFTDRWHHQVSVDGRPIVFARSAPGADSSGWRVRQVARSLVAEKLDAAIAWIDDDRNVTEDFLVKLLVAANYHLHALWLLGDVGRSFVFVADAPRPLAHIEIRALHTSEEFLAELRRVEPIIGIASRR